MESSDLGHYDLGRLLHRNDTMGMAASIESRFPFLDSAFVRLAVNMPHSVDSGYPLDSGDPNP